MNKKILSFVFVFIFVFEFYGCNIRANTSDGDIISSLVKVLREDYGSGEGVNIAIIDSGTSLSNEIYALNFSEEENVYDSIDHGIPIQNIISNATYGLAPKATVYSLKVMNKYGNASLQSVFNALEWCLNNSIDIINMSMSFGIYSENIDCIISELIENGVIIVSSIANNYKEIDYPSMYDGVICVGKTELSDLYNQSSSIIFQTDYIVKALGQDDKINDYVGNSFLAPIVTGTIACLIDKNEIEGSVTNADLISKLEAILQQIDIRINNIY